MLYVQLLHYIFRRCESFNGMVRRFNVHGNRQSPSRDIATMFATIGNLSGLAMGQVDVDGRYALPAIYNMKGYSVYIHYWWSPCTLCVCLRYIIRQAGQGLCDLLRTPQVEHFLFGTPMSELAEKQIYKHGALRKVQCTYYHKHISFAWFI